VFNIIRYFLIQNSYPLKKWHIENMEKTIIKYVKGLPVDATRWEIRKNKKYGKLSNIVRNINYDIKHGVTNEQVLEVFLRIRNEPLFLDLQNNIEAMNRLGDLERQLKSEELIG
jgi:hypothetical protein